MERPLKTRLRSCVTSLTVVFILALSPLTFAQALSDGCARHNDPQLDGFRHNAGLEWLDLSFRAGETIRITAGLPISGSQPTSFGWGWQGGPSVTADFPGELTYQFRRDVTMRPNAILSWGADAYLIDEQTWSVECFLAPIPPTPIPASSIFSKLALILALLGASWYYFGLRTRVKIN